MLQSDKSHKSRASITKGSPCAPFDYCMRLKGAPRGSKTYVSMEEWVIEPQSDFNPQQIVKTLAFDRGALSGADR